ncbi:CheR family methyltransferase [Sagittula sp. SSi028]|uniref:CheR family methyltransferase n=1 Tax=Sagittula sp. SSi028 TaxID=3400636 RepID=UPI003AF83919
MKNAFPVVGVGASAGGLEALRELFSGPAGDVKLGMSFVVIQHLDPNHESLMAQLIERYTSMTVTQAAGGEVLEQDHIYVIPPGHGLSIQAGRLHLTEFTDPRGLRRPIDDFFETLARDCGPLSACVILSGTGADGTRGLRAIKEYGGVCVVQDPESASYDGMPTSAIGTGLADYVAHPSDILNILNRFFDFSETQKQADVSTEIFDFIKDICDTIQHRLGHDFTKYKRSTLSRRIARRMQVRGLESPRDYLTIVRSDDEECAALFQDLLINVTRFFRDPVEFGHLDEMVVRPLVDSCDPDGEIRVWVAGCSSGEEAYSIAMLLHRAMLMAGKKPLVQVFATDIDPKMLDIARAGAYPLSALPDIPEDLRNRYTVAGSNSFTITQNIRDMVRFSLHSVIKDPPFSKIDLVSCRNLLIYFDESLQRDVVPLLHFSLREDGYLFLGASEAISRYEDMFRIVSQSARLFRRQKGAARYSLRLPQQNRPNLPTPQPFSVQTTRRPNQNSAEQTALRRLAEAYAPASMLVDSGGNLLHRYGNLSKFLDFPDGRERSLHVPSLAKHGLREVIGGQIRDASSKQRKLLVRDVQVDTGLGKLGCDVMCEPLEDGTVLVILRETGVLVPSVPDGFEEIEPGDGHLRYLELELQSTRHRLDTTVEELETTNEELKSSNEEMLSMNEELQSTNEELTTVNDELKSKVDELVVANTDLSNFFNSTELAVVVVDQDLRVRSFTEAAGQLFGLEKGSVGHRFGDVSGGLSGTDFVGPLAQAAGEASAQEFRVHSEDTDQDFVARALPYKRNDGTYAGATLVLADVTDTLKLERNLEEERHRLQLALKVARIGVWEYEPVSDQTRIDETERELLDVDPEEGAQMETILARLEPEARDRVNGALRQAMDGTRDFNEIFALPLRDGGRRWLHGMGRRYGDSLDNKFIGVTYDVTAERDLLDQRELMIREMNHRVKNLFAIISALISISAREASDVSEFAMGLRARIRSLAESHGLTNNGADVRPAPVREVIETVLRPSLSSQTVEITGDAAPVRIDQMTSIALILHEWGTNSTKYGALSVDDGRIDVSISVADGMAHVDWRETGGNGAATTGNGFGTALVDATAKQLGATVNAGPIDGGFQRKLAFPCDG